MADEKKTEVKEVEVTASEIIALNNFNIHVQAVILKKFPLLKLTAKKWEELLKKEKVID